MPSILPKSRPKADEQKVRAILGSHGIPTADEPVAILAVRGYYRDSMGKPGVQETGIYDDALFLVGPKGLFKSVNANTDPVKLGWNSGVGKEFAMLVPGLWYFIRGAHKKKAPALRQATEDEAEDAGIPNYGHFTVWRARNMAEVTAGTARRDTGYHAINTHRGGEATTSSWGCQTIPPSQFDDFMVSVWEATKKAEQFRIPYLLIDGPIN